MSAGKINTTEQQQAVTLLQNVQRILQPVTVINPFAEQLQIPKEVFKQRRTNAHYLAFIEVITFYKQHEREQKVDEAAGEIFIETTIEDIEEANKLMKEILLRKSDELSGACRNYFEQLKESLEKNKQSSFTNTSIRNQLRIALLSAGLIRKIENRNTKAYHFETVTTEEYTKLLNSISTALDEALQKIKYPPIGSTSAHKQNEPRKRRIINYLHEQPTGV